MIGELNEDEKNDCGVSSCVSLLQKASDLNLEEIQGLSQDVGLDLLQSEELKSYSYTPVEKFKTAKNMIEDSFNDCFLMTSKNKELREILREASVLRKLDKGEVLEFTSEKPLDQVIMIRMGSLNATIESGEG